MRLIFGIGISCLLLATFLILPACGQPTSTNSTTAEDRELTTSPVTTSIIPSETVPVTSSNSTPAISTSDTSNPPFPTMDVAYLSFSNTLLNFDIQQGASAKYDWMYLSANQDRIDWSVDVDSSWVKLSQTSGIVTRTTTQIKITVDATRLSKGAYTCKMTFKAAAFGFPQIIEVHLTVT
jgi:hypothetical protein